MRRVVRASGDVLAAALLAALAGPAGAAREVAPVETVQVTAVAEAAEAVPEAAVAEIAPEAAAAALPPRSELSIQVAGARMTLQAREAPLDEILQAIGRLTDLEINCPERLPERVNLTLQDMPFSEAMQRVLDGHDFILRLERPYTRIVGALRVFARDTGRSGQAE